MTMEKLLGEILLLCETFSYNVLKKIGVVNTGFWKGLCNGECNTILSALIHCTGTWNSVALALRYGS